MTFEEIIMIDPMVNSLTAIPILSHLALTQYGILNPVNMNKADHRIREDITNVMLSSESVTKKFYRVIVWNSYGAPDEIEVDYDQYRQCDESDSYMLVNFFELFAEYNKFRDRNGLGLIRLSPNSHCGHADGQNISSSALADLATSICQIVTNIVSRDDLMKAETLESIIDEGLNKISDEQIKTAIPKIKSELRDSLNSKIIKGRLSNVVDKKIHSAIYLSEKQTRQTVDFNRINLRKDLAKFDLSKKDREHVVDVFIEYKKATMPE
jgi:hypothetical protein